MLLEESAPLVAERPAKRANGGVAARVALGACALAIAATVLVAGATSRANAPPTGSPATAPATPDLARRAGVDGPNPDQPRPTAFTRINPTVKPTGYPVHIDYSTPMPTRYTSPYPTAYNTQPTPLPTAAPAITSSKQTKNPPTKNPMPTRPKSPAPSAAPAR